MLANLLKRLGQLFPGNNYQSRLDRYISSHNPQNTGDVENLQRQYDQAQYDRGLI